MEICFTFQILSMRVRRVRDPSFNLWRINSLITISMTVYIILLSCLNSSIIDPCIDTFACTRNIVQLTIGQPEDDFIEIFSKADLPCKKYSRYINDRDKKININ